MAGFYNGHSKPAEESDDRELIRRPKYSVHGANCSSAKSILRQGLQSAGRQDSHMGPLPLNPRQEAYTNPDDMKTHLLVVGGAIVSSDGIAIHKLGDDAIVSKGMNGSIHP